MAKTITISEEQIKVLLSALSLKEVQTRKLHNIDKELVKQGHDYMKDCIKINQNELKICKELQKILNK